MQGKFLLEAEETPEESIQNETKVSSWTYARKIKNMYLESICDKEDQHGMMLIWIENMVTGNIWFALFYKRTFPLSKTKGVTEAAAQTLMFYCEVSEDESRNDHANIGFKKSTNGEKHGCKKQCSNEALSF